MHSPRRRIDDASALFDHLIAHASLALAIAVAIVALTVPAMRGTLIGALVVGALAAGRLVFHPLRLTSISRVYLEGERVLVAPLVGRAREVEVVAVEHDGHSPWPCTLSLADGGKVQFVARRDDGSASFLDLNLSDRARYQRPADARDSIASIEMAVRASRPPRIAEEAA